MERAAVYESAIWRHETTPGSGTGQLYRLLSTYVSVDQEPQIRTFKSEASKFVTSSSTGKEHSTFSLRGDQSFNDLLFLLRSLANKGGVATPTNNNIWNIGVGAANAGTIKLTFEGDETAAIAYNAAAATVKTALVALDSVAIADNITVTGASPNWVVTLKGPLANKGAITIAPTGLTGGTATAVAGATAVAARRWTITPSWNSADESQTYEIQKGVSGVADAAVQAKMAQISGLVLTWNTSEASLTGDGFADRLDDPFTMATADIEDLPVVPIDPACISAWIGNGLTGADSPVKMTRLQSMVLTFTGKWQELKVLDCDVDGISGGVELVPEATVQFTVMHNAQSQGWMADMREGTFKYIVFEALGDNIETGYRHKFRWVAPVKITGIQKGEGEGVFTSTYTAEIAYTTDMGSGITFQIDTTIAAF